MYQMVKRAVCMSNGKCIGIETIYTVINGMQINIEEKLAGLRLMSKTSNLFCPCGCGANLILVAGDKNLRVQHFRIKPGTAKKDCNAVTESESSIKSKIVLKCWLEDKLKTSDIETRVPIDEVGNSKRKYEFSFLSYTRKIAISYCYDRTNLSDEKIDILERHKEGLQIVYVVDARNLGNNGQYPEWLKLIQDRQGYCIMLDAKCFEYNQAWMYAVCYMQNIDGIWHEIKFAEGSISEFTINDCGQVCFRDTVIDMLKSIATKDFITSTQLEKERREQARIVREQEARDRDTRIKMMRRENSIQRISPAKQMSAPQSANNMHSESSHLSNISEADFSQQEIPIRDANGNRWIKCEQCGLIAIDTEFVMYGGKNHVNLGKCRKCCNEEERRNADVSEKTTENIEKPTKDHSRICPDCGANLVERNGQYGRFIGCSNYPKCRYTRKIK